MEMLEPRRLLSVGEPDLFFGSDGITWFAAQPRLTAGVDSTRALATLPDGRFYLAGSGSSGKSGTEVALGRLTFDGNPDPTFNNGQVLLSDLPNVQNEVAQSAVLQPDGKLVLLCTGRGPAGTWDFVLARYDPDGGLDPSFGAGGIVTTDFGPDRFGRMPDDWGNKLLLQPDGKFIVLGVTGDGNKGRGALARYNPDGSLDASFGTGGKIVLDLSPEFGGIGGEFNSGLLLPDGKLLALGAAYFDGSWGTSKLVLARFLANGQLDPSFSNTTGGPIRIETDLHYPSDIAAAPDGGYYVNTATQYSFGVMKFTSDGTLDTGWGSAGQTIVFNSNAPTLGRGSLLVQPDGSIIAAHGWNGGLVWGRILPDGQLDTSVGPYGYVYHRFGNNGEGGDAMALQPDGRILITGSGEVIGGNPGLIAARYRSMPDPASGCYLDPGTGIITVIGTPQADLVHVAADSATGDVRINLNGVEQTFVKAAVKRVDLRMFDGDDDVTFTSGAPAGMVDLAEGNDSILYSSPTASSLSKVFCGAGDDSVRLIDGAGSSVTLDGGAGDDGVTLIGSAGPDVIQVAGGTANGFGYTTHFGTVDFDPRLEQALYSAPEHIMIDAADGADTISTAGTLYGPVTLSGGDGDDVLDLQAPEVDNFHNRVGFPVTLSGGDGTDLLTYGSPTNNNFLSLLSSSLALGATATVGLADPIERVQLTGTTASENFNIRGSNANVTVTGGGGTDALNYGGTDDDDIINIELDSIKRGGDLGPSVNLIDMHALSVDGSDGNDVINLNSTQTGVPVTVSGGKGNDVLHINVAPLAPLTFLGGTDAGSADTLDIQRGAYTFLADARQTTANLTVDVASGASVAFDATQHLAGLNLLGGSATMSARGSTVLVTETLAIADEGTLDLADNDLIVRGGNAGTWGGSNYDGLTGLLAAGSIFSSTTQARSTTLGIATASDLLGISGTQTGNWNGQTVSAGDVLVKYTYVGDANLDGKINIDDYGRIDSHVGQSGIAFGWYNGDFNFDGKINIDDYGLIDSIIGAQGPVL